MKANFALSLSLEGIRLLHRATGGWNPIGEVALDDPGLVSALEALRQTALDLEPDGLLTKLILPEDQVKYMTIPIGDASVDTLTADTEAALTGATPYAVSELAYDVTPDGDVAHIAAVARDTLDEAEAFAVEYRFNPISFVALPQSGNFKGEPFFGPTALSTDLLDAGDTVEPDGAAINIPPDLDADTSPALPEHAEPTDITSNSGIDATDGNDHASADDVLKPPTLDGVTRASAPIAPGGVLSGSVPGTELVSALASEAPPPPGGFISRRGNRWRASDQKVRTEPALTTSGTARGNVAPDREMPFDAPEPDLGGDVAAGGKPRYLGLMLTAALIVFLAGVAAWASVFLDEETDNALSRLLKGEPADEPAISAAILKTPPKQMSTPERTYDREEVVTASLAQEVPYIAPAPEALAVPVPDPEFDPETATEKYAVSGIWSIPPEVPTAPGMLTLDGLYVTSIDSGNLSFDAVALVPERDFRVDETIKAPANPAPPGTAFKLDDRGMVVATLEGALTPDGVLVYRGPPVAVPPTIPERAEPEPEPEITQAQLALAGLRPRLRPTNLVENSERRNLGGLTRSELAAFRPALRPETTKQAEELDETPTARAIAASARPTMRPNDFASTIAAARTRQAAPAAPEPQRVAAVAPRTVQPKNPTRTSVTKEATIKNAIRMNRINLMGVYGTPNNRRALVRLSNGKYKKVKVGDRIDGGRVSAIGEGELRYRKGSRDVVLTMPRT